MTDGYYYTASLGGKRVRVAAKYVLVVIAIVFFAAGFAAGILVKTYLITARGNIVIITPPELKLTFYSHENATAEHKLTEIDWGSLEPGETKTFNAWVKNRGDVPFTMGLNTDNWNPPEAADYITVSWDYADQPVSVGEVLPVTFTLSVDSGISGIDSFSFDIVITATEA